MQTVNKASEDVEAAGFLDAQSRKWLRADYATGGRPQRSLVGWVSSVWRLLRRRGRERGCFVDEGGVASKRGRWTWPGQLAAWGHGCGAVLLINAGL